MLRRSRRPFVTWLLLVVGLIPSLAPPSADGGRKKNVKKDRASRTRIKGDFVLRVVPTHPSPVAAASGPRQGKILAVVIGVGKFQQAEIRPLRYPAKDATDFAAWLRSVGVPAQNFGWIGHLNEAIVSRGSAVYDVFPSLHVLITCVLLDAEYRFSPRLFWLLLPWAVLLVLSTVILRYHYAVDLLAGAVLFVVLRLWFSWWSRRYSAA